MTDLIPFGSDRWSPGGAHVQWGEILRINGGALILPEPGPATRDLSMVNRVAAHLKRLAGQWNTLSIRYVDAYLEHVAAEIAAHRAEIDAKLAPLQGLFAAEDFLYSAPLPLPRAFLHAPPEDGAKGDTTDFVPVDFAFWLKEGAVAQLLRPSSLTPMAERRREERLRAAGVRVEHWSVTDLTSANGAWFKRLIGSSLTFWEDEVLPAAPGLARW